MEPMLRSCPRGRCRGARRLRRRHGRRRLCPQQLPRLGRRPPLWHGNEPGLGPPASPQAIAAAEAMLGFRLPALLRRIYEDVADGGLGPAYGIFPIASHYTAAGQDETVVEVRDKLAVDPR